MERKLKQACFVYNNNKVSFK